MTYPMLPRVEFTGDLQITFFDFDETQVAQGHISFEKKPLFVFIEAVMRQHSDLDEKTYYEIIGFSAEAGKMFVHLDSQ